MSNNLLFPYEKRLKTRDFVRARCGSRGEGKVAFEIAILLKKRKIHLGYFQPSNYCDFK